MECSLGTASISSNGQRTETYNLVTERRSKVVGCMLTAAGTQLQHIDLEYHLPQASIFFYANPWILLDRSVSISKRLKYFNLLHVLAAGTGQSTTPSWLLWMFSFENYADQSLDRRQKLIGMRLRTRFLLQMQTLIHGPTSYAKTTGIRRGMLPLYLHIGGFNACYRGIFLVLVASAVHDILGNPNLMRIAGTQIWDHGERSGWRRVEITFSFICQFLPHVNISFIHTCCYFCACALKRVRHWRAGLTWKKWRSKKIFQFVNNRNVRVTEGPHAPHPMLWFVPVPSSTCIQTIFGLIPCQDHLAFVSVTVVGPASCGLFACCTHM